MYDFYQSNTKSEAINDPEAAAQLLAATLNAVEQWRNDGLIMKIHTTQDSIPTLIHTFFADH